MIATLYDKFKPWSQKGSVFIVSDTHFDDWDCPLMDPDWIAPAGHILRIKKKIHGNDTLIHLGDVGNPAYLDEIKCYKVLIMGNHDQSKTRFKDHFDEIYEGPLFVAPKLLLSHEPVPGLDWCFNIHGHDHSRNNPGDDRHLNLAANVVGYEPLNLGDFIRKGGLAGIKDIHRETIERATERKQAKQERGSAQSPSKEAGKSRTPGKAAAEQLKGSGKTPKSGASTRSAKKSPPKRRSAKSKPAAEPKES